MDTQAWNARRIDHAHRHGGQIDIVYLWVDGSDPLWQVKRQQTYASWASRHAGDLAAYGNVLGRFRDNEELRYNLRALERFFPDHGHVYIVTDAQTPTWLRDVPGVTVVDHRALIPASDLPVFDSGHIESYIHRIAGLSERFFYLNDDIFFGAPVDPSEWFGTRLSIAMETVTSDVPEALDPTETALVNAASLSRRWLRSRYPEYRHDPRLCAHAPRPLLRSAMFELESLAPERFRQVRSTPFRSWRVPPIVSDLVLRWMMHTGLAAPVTREHLYIATGTDDAAQSFEGLAERFGELPFFCINDTCDDASADDARLRRVSRQLGALLSRRSKFEADLSRDDSRDGSMHEDQPALSSHAPTASHTLPRPSFTAPSLVHAHSPSNPAPLPTTTVAAAA